MNRSLLLLVLLVASSAPTTSAETWLIKPNGTGDAQHISAGVDSCMPGDTLLLDTGTFNGPNNRQITVNKSIVICSVGGPLVTTIHCQRSGMAFDFDGAQNSALKGITIAWSWTQPGEEAPVLIRSGASLEVSNCVFHDGRSLAVGAIRCDDAVSSLDVSNCEFRDNFGGTSCGAVFSFGALTNVRDCWFESNGSNGDGALSVWSPVLPSVIENNTFWNTAGGQNGAAIFIKDNQAPVTLRFRNNTIVGTTGDPDFSGAVYISGDFLLIEYNIIAFNNVKAFWCGSFGSPVSVVQCNNIFDNLSNEFCPDLVTGGNVFTDPLFCDTANGDFKIHEASPSAPNNNTCGVLFGAWPVGCVVGVGDGTPNLEYKLLGNAPNPFNPATVIRYSVPERGAVTLEIFDITGALVRTFTREHASGGVKQLVWAGRDDRGQLVASGVYVYRMTAPGFTESRKMLLLK
jgi:hypothetical protein